MQVYVFKNIRYAAPPVGVLRWQKPMPPPRTYEVLGGKLENATACTQPIRSDVRTAHLNKTVGPGQEDCLFLDLTIPKRVYDNPWAKLPVLAWVHGGYYSE
jgi:carboxylesterase type B